jgi:hypothetical protein
MTNICLKQLFEFVKPNLARVPMCAIAGRNSRPQQLILAAAFQNCGTAASTPR